MGIKIIYIEGQLLGNCVFLRDSHVDRKGKQSRRFAYFICKCGDEFEANIDKVKNSETISCMNCRKEIVRNRFTIHGLSGTSEHRIWRHILSRCYNENVKYYNDYGGRGIIVCDRWLNSFENFYADMGPRPSLNHSIDRWPNKNGNYELGNCRWATTKEQNLNRRSNLLVEYNGEVKTLTEWVNLLKLPYAKIRVRIKELNWNISKAFETPC